MEQVSSAGITDTTRYFLKQSEAKSLNNKGALWAEKVKHRLTFGGLKG